MNTDTTIRTIPQLDNQNDNFLVDLFSTNGWLIFLVLVVFSSVIQFFTSEFILTDEFMYNTYAEQLTVERVDEILNSQKRMAWLPYVFIPLILVLQSALIAICFSTLFFLKNAKVKFGILFKIAMTAGIIFIMGKMVVTGILMFSEVSTAADMEKGNLFSLLTWIGSENVPDWTHVCLSYINIFQIGFILLSAFAFKQLKLPTQESALVFVLKSYGVGLILWMAFISFLILNLQT